MKRADALLPPLALLLVGVASVWPILSTGNWYSANQAYRYPYLMELFKASFLAGHVYPRWLPELFGGYGFPTFLYYPPGFWFAALPFALVLPNVLHAMYATLIVLFFFGGLGAYRLARLTLASWPALFCAVLFLLTPYFAVQLYIRGSLSELAAMLLCPWAFLCLWQLKEAVAQGRPATLPALLLAVALAAMVATHLLLTLWLGLAFAAILAVALAGRDCPRGFLPVLLASTAVAAALASPYWYPAFSLRGAVMFQRGLWAGAPIEFQEFVALKPRMTGLPWTLLALAGLWLGRKDRLTQGVALASAILLFFMLPISTTIWDASRLLQLTQHPGRIFSIFATLQMLATVACVAHLSRRTHLAARWQAAAGLVVILAVVATMPGRYRVRETLDYQRFRFEAARTFEDMTHNHELTPRGARVRGLPPRMQVNTPIAEAHEGAALTIESQRGDDIRLQADVSSAPAAVTLNQVAFPGWRLTLDEHPLPPCQEGEAACWQADEHGRMRIVLPGAGSVLLHAWFDGPPHWRLRSILALAVAVSAFVLLRRYDRRTVERGRLIPESLVAP